MQKYESHSTEIDPLLTELSAAALLHLSVRTLQSWRGRGTGPSFVRMGRAIRYRRSDLEQWVSSNIVSMAGEAGRQQNKGA